MAAAVTRAIDEDLLNRPGTPHRPAHRGQPRAAHRPLPWRRAARRRAAAVAVTTAGCVVVGGVALAVVTAAGAGPGSGQVTAQVTELVIASVPGADGIYPAGPPVPVPVVLTNRTPRPLAVQDLTADLSGLGPTCPADAWVVIVPASLPTIPAAGTASITLGVSLTAAAPASCAGREFSVPVTARGEVR